MVNWDEIYKVQRQCGDCDKDSLLFKQWESLVRDNIEKMDNRIKDWNRTDVHQLRSLWIHVKKLTVYAKNTGLDCDSIFEEQGLPSEPVPDHLKGIVLAIDMNGNRLMNDSVLSIEHAPKKRDAS
ncbi:MAG: hypothetical protein PHS86_13085 [Syntrophaceae bacterium]|nr:hypothetical protein [Syntrophaceae bacterium]